MPKAIFQDLIVINGISRWFLSCPSPCIHEIKCLPKVLDMVEISTPGLDQVGEVILGAEDNEVVDNR